MYIGVNLIQGVPMVDIQNSIRNILADTDLENTSVGSIRREIESEFEINSNSDNQLDYALNLFTT